MEPEYGAEFPLEVFAPPGDARTNWPIDIVVRAGLSSVAARFNPAEFGADEWATTFKDFGIRYVVITSKHHDGFALFQSMDRYVRNKSLPQVKGLLENSELDLIWFDTPVGMNLEWDKLFSDMFRKHRPDCLINGCLIHTGKEKIEAQYLPLYDYVSIGDKEVPTRKLRLDVKSPDRESSSFGYKTRGDCHFQSEEKMLHRFVHTVCAGGNALINNGPMGNGKLDPEAVRLYGVIGNWLKVNGESSCRTRRNPLPRRPQWGDISVSKDGETLYLHILQWPESETIPVDDLPAAAASAVDRASGKKAGFVQECATLRITLPAVPLNEYDTLLQVGFTESLGDSAQIPARPTHSQKDGKSRKRR